MAEVSDNVDTQTFQHLQGCASCASSTVTSTT